MSKTNGNGQHNSADDLRAAAELAIKLTTEATNGPYRLTEQNHGNTRYKQRVIRAAQNWRRRPRRNAPKWPEFDDVATLCGGESEQAKKNGELLAAAPELLKKLAFGILELQARTPVEDDKPTKAIPPCPLNDFLAYQVAAFAALGFNETGDYSIDQLVRGDRQKIAAVLREFTQLLDPASDTPRFQALHPSERLPVNGIPTAGDLFVCIEPHLRKDFLKYTNFERELARWDSLAQKRYGVEFWEICSKILHRRAHLAAIRLEREKDKFTPLDVVNENGEWTSEDDAGWAWYEHHMESIMKMTAILETSDTWQIENADALQEEFNTFFEKPPSGLGLISDLFITKYSTS